MTTQGTNATRAPASEKLTDSSRASVAIERLLAFVRHDTYSESEHPGDAHVRGWCAAMLHVEGWLERERVRGAKEARTLSCLRELRDVGFAPGVLFEGVTVIG